MQRSRKVADGRVKGVHFLMKKNNITEFDGWGTFADANTLDVALNDGDSETVTFDHCIIATGATTKLLPGTQLSERVVTYEEQILTEELPGSIIIAGAGAIGVEFAYVLAQLRREGDHRRVPRPDGPAGGRRGLQGAGQGATRSSASTCSPRTRVDSIDDSGDKVKVTVTGKDGEQQTLEADKVMQAIGFQPRVDGYGLEKTGVAADRARRDRHRRPLPHQRAAHLRHRRRDREADARARRRGDGRHRRRDHRRAPRRWSSTT